MKPLYEQPRPVKISPLLDTLALSHSSDWDAQGLTRLIRHGAFPVLRSIVHLRGSEAPTFFGTYDVNRPEVYWALLSVTWDTPRIQLGQRRNMRLKHQSERFTGFARLFAEGKGFPKLKQLVLSRGYVVGADDYDEINALLPALGRGAPLLELLELKCTLLPGLEAPLGKGCRLAPGSLPRLKKLIVQMPMDPDYLRSLLLAAGPSLKTLHVESALCMLADATCAPLWLHRLESLTVRNFEPNSWTCQIPPRWSRAWCVFVR